MNIILIIAPTAELPPVADLAAPAGNRAWRSLQVNAGGSLEVVGGISQFCADAARNRGTLITAAGYSAGVVTIRAPDQKRRRFQSPADLPAPSLHVPFGSPVRSASLTVPAALLQ